MSYKYCTACENKSNLNNINNYKSHPLLDVPICKSCWSTYHKGSFDIIDNSEIYCRWCGEGNGQLLLCDSCPKGFCESCITRNFGFIECKRIIELNNRWFCYICSPQPIIDLLFQNGWIDDININKRIVSNNDNNIGNNYNTISGRVILNDISRGREKYEIPVVNEVDKTGPPLDFTYVTTYVPGNNVKLSNNPNLFVCCTCEDNCKDPTRCECILQMDGLAYDNDGMLIIDEGKVNGIYECNDRCSCHLNRCKNRIVGNGPNIPLEVYRVSNEKGWGVRCKVDINIGTFIATYLGEILSEFDADERGLAVSDEYIFNLDAYARTLVCHQLTKLGMKSGYISVPKDQDYYVPAYNRNRLEDLLGDDMTNLLAQSGAIDRMIVTGNKRKNDFIEFQQNKKKSNSEMSYYDYLRKLRVLDWRVARSILNDRIILETEEHAETYCVDARTFGSVGRFLNHSCEPNLFKVSVFCNDSQDARLPRVAFFSSNFIPAYTELCYDYGYFDGNVDGKHRLCHCGANTCRKVMY